MLLFVGLGAGVYAQAPPTFAKLFFSDTIVAGGTSTLTFQIDNTLGGVAATGLDFTDNLPAGVVIASPASASTTCTGGTLTAVSGTAVITYAGGTVAAMDRCLVEVDVTAATPGTYNNTSGALTSSQGSSGTASATLNVDPLPSFTKSFAPATIAPGGVSTLALTVDNSASALSVQAIDFTDNLPAAVTIATPANAFTTCTGGILTATSGTSVVSYSGGSIGGGATCTVFVDVTSNTLGTHVNTTGDLTTASGNSGPAMASLVVSVGPAPAFSKSFAPGTIAPGGTTTLIFTIDNTGNGVAATGLDFTDTLPGGVTVASPSGAGTTCTGGTLTAASGSSVISYTGGTVGGGVSCTVSVDVTSSTPGNAVNTTGPLTSSAGGSGTANATLSVAAPVPTMPEWVALSLAGILLAMGAVHLRRRRAMS